ncbi:YdcH family protein [Thalassotalea maritima]|uniref:YdcH family protein n=1 Tax=Thalassotalea maritima TaxID=3242416 RepID=UPI0035290256
MLGEKHSLLDDFPEFSEVIKKLMADSPQFSEKNKRYNELDKEIRVLELNNAPIDDEAMHQLKHDRAVLKDELFEALQSAN